MELDLALGVLDHQLLDADGRRCGKVDDLELEGIREGDEVAEDHAGVRVRRKAPARRLGRSDDRARGLVEKLPGSSL